MKMRRMAGIRTGLLVLLGMGLWGCAAGGTLLFPAMASTPYPPPGYAHRVESSHVALYWNCTQPEPGLLQLAGRAFNPWSDQPVRFLELELVGVDDREHTVSGAKAEAADLQIYTNQSTPFQLDLRTAGTEVRFDLYYQYRFQDRGHNAIVAGPVPGGSFRLAQQTIRSLARDVCSETQHRWR
jgi:hypothetical protein